MKAPETKLPHPPRSLVWTLGVILAAGVAYWGYARYQGAHPAPISTLAGQEAAGQGISGVIPGPASTVPGSPSGTSHILGSDNGMHDTGDPIGPGRAPPTGQPGPGPIVGRPPRG